MAGLLDQFEFAGNAQAFNMTEWMAEYFYNRVQNVISKYTIERHWYSLNEEVGGMNDVLYRLYTLSVGYFQEFSCVSHSIRTMINQHSMYFIPAEFNHLSFSILHI